MPNAPVIQTFLQFCGLKRETTVGTFAAPSLAQDFLFCDEIAFEDIQEDVYDQSWQGSAAQEAGYYPGIQSAKATLKGIVSQAAMGHLFRAALGAITESGVADPYTHNFALRVAQGPTYSITNFDGTQANARAIENARLQTLKLTYSGVKGLLMFEAVFLGKWVDIGQAKPTATFDTAPHYLAYQGALTYGGAANGKLQSLSWAIENEVAPVPGSTGSQAINDVSQNRTRVVLDVTFAPTDATEYNLYRTNTQQAFSMLFTNTGSHTLTLQTSKLALTNGTKVVQSGHYVTVQAKASGINNATDGGPAKVILLNAIATGGY